jgi:AcrR family transcriptional regulator
MPRVFPNYKVEAKNSIMRAALDLFREKGYHATTMEQIAERLGVSKGTIYTYYESKEELLVTAIKGAPATIMTVLQDSISDGDPHDPVGSIFDILVEVVRSYSPGLFFEVMSEASRNEVIRTAVKEDSERTIKVIIDFLGDLVKGGHIRDDVDREALARGMSSLYYGLMADLVLGTEEATVRRTWTTSISSMLVGAAPDRP